MTVKKTTLKLPIGVQTFSDIREGGYYYVDKTPIIQQLVEEGKYYFLSRPRRFGKSLLLDTLRCLFEARQQLFEGLYIADRWNWQRSHPVIRISFADGVMKNREALDQHIHELLNENCKRLGLTLQNHSIAGRFRELLMQAHQQHGERAVVLIDEYDKPILDNILDTGIARELTEGLKNLQQIKDKGYANKYLGSGKKIHMIGVEFSSQQRQIVGFEAESLDDQVK